MRLRKPAAIIELCETRSTRAANVYLAHGYTLLEVVTVDLARATGAIRVLCYVLGRTARVPAISRDTAYAHLPGPRPEDAPPLTEEEAPGA